MTLKVVYVEIIDGRLILPAEALAVLPSGTPLYMLVDPEKERVTVHARDLRKLPNQEFLESLADLNEGLTLEEYTRPVSESDLRRNKSKSDKGER